MASVLERLDGCPSLIIYGQRDYVHRISSYLSKLRPDMHLTSVCFPIPDRKAEGEPFDWDMHDAEMKGLPRSETVFVAVPLSRKKPAGEHLECLGFRDLVFYGPKVDNEFKWKYLSAVYAEEGKDFLNVYELPEKRPLKDLSIEVYMAQCTKDIPLKSRQTAASDVLVPIQAGAAVSRERIAACTDDTGDNISERNRHYSEMTVFYWMWKNAAADYLGLCHYRRIFVNLELIAEKIRGTDVEAILPMPTIYETSVRKNHVDRYFPQANEVMMEALREKQPECYEELLAMYRQRLMYTNNMCILRRDVLGDLCSWMFPIVMEVERRMGEVDDPYVNRYAGFCTECLISLYFMRNWRSWKIAHAEKVFLF